MIPVEIDPIQILDDLHAAGWRDQKIEIALGFSAGYCAKLRSGPRVGRPYQMLARLYNFWYDEQASATRQTVALTTM